WWEEAKQIKMFKSTASDIYKHFVIKYVTVKRHNPPAWWPDQTAFTGYNDTYVGVAEDIDCPWDTLGTQTGRNYGGYDAVKDIAWQQGFDWTAARPAYNNYFAGIALAKIKTTDSQVPYSAHIVKNDVYLYPTSPWGWIDDQLYTLAADPTVGYVQDPDSAVDRSTVVVAKKIAAGNDPNASQTYAVIMAVGPTGLAQLQTTIDTGRAIVAREYPKYPAICGDATGGGIIDGGDVVYLVTYLYRGGPAPVCPMERGDVTGDGIINGGDVIYLVAYLYKGGPAPNCKVGLW
ncbi:MAG: hypothetical protein WCE90_11995, partial [Candidatus Zixiibacteriota bacterium]